MELLPKRSVTTSRRRVKLSNTESKAGGERERERKIGTDKEREEINT